jgi:hypothetical protein
VAFVANQKQPIQLYKSLWYREITLRLQGQPTLTAANNTVANTAKGDEWGVVKKIEVIANSSDVVFSCSGDDLWWLARYNFGSNPRITPTLGDGATANPAFDSTLTIPFWAVRSAKPMDTILQSDGLQDFRLEITWGTFTDVNTAATAWTANPTIEVGSHESEPTPMFSPAWIKRIVKSTQSVAGAQAAFRFPLDVGPAYRGFLINATTPAGVDTAGLFSNVKLISGSTVFYDQSESMLAQMGNLRNGLPFNIEKVITTGLAYATNPRISASSNLLAWYNLDLCPDGYLSEAISSRNVNELYLEFVTTAAATINVISTQLLPNPRYNPNARAAA